MTVGRLGGLGGPGRLGRLGRLDRLDRLPGHDGRVLAVTLISDDNFSATQTTRVLSLAARLP
jgi:hypothetical protein